MIISLNDDVLLWCCDKVSMYWCDDVELLMWLNDDIVMCYIMKWLYNYVIMGWWVDLTMWWHVDVLYNDELYDVMHCRVYTWSTCIHDLVNLMMWIAMIWD